ncbi:MAG: GNAT family N-acetyltransferase [Paludibacteraceae bacterium]|nr:GNAT family N-acetyltransferase [Paludibacteraceae bacterium]
MTNKEQYHSFCCQHAEIPLFQQAWWMECVSGKNDWDVLLELDNDNRIIAFLPYMIVRKYGFRLILQPLLSQCNGIWISPKANDKEAIIQKFIHKIEALKPHWFMQFFPSSAQTDIWGNKNYIINQRHTYVIENLSNSSDSIFKSFSTAQQRQIRKAGKNGINILEDSSAEDFYQYHSFCLAQRGEKNLNSPNVEITLCQEAFKRGLGTILYAKDINNKTIAALFLVWDATTAYYLIPTFDYDQKTSGASSLLVWHAIRLAKEKGLKRFDFEGSMQNSIANFYKQFGSTEVCYPQIEKTNHPFIRLWKFFHQ